MRKKLRICKNQEFSQILSRRRFVKTSALVLYYAPKSAKYARIGISAGKKLGSAVTRTTARRRLRAAVDQVFDFCEPFDCIIMIRQPFLKQNFEQSVETLAALRRKASKQMAGESAGKTDE